MDNAHRLVPLLALTVVLPAWGVFEFTVWLAHLPLLAGALTLAPILWFGPLFLTEEEIDSGHRLSGVWRFPIQTALLFALLAAVQLRLSHRAGFAFWGLVWGGILGVACFYRRRSRIAESASRFHESIRAVSNYVRSRAWRVKRTPPPLR